MRESFSVGLKVVIIFLVLAMVGNVLMLARSFELEVPGEITDTEIVREVRESLRHITRRPLQMQAFQGIQQSEMPWRSLSLR